MPYEPAEIVSRYAAAAPAHPNGKALAPDAARAWASVQRGTGRLGASPVRDSARREWLLEAWRDPARGRFVVLRPAHGDLEPFRASADGHRPDTHLAVAPAEWELLALLAAGHDGDGGRADEELATAAARLVDRMVRDAHHHQLLGAAEDEEA